MKEKCIELLSGLVNKNYTLITRRGNKSILLALKLAKELGNKDLLIQDQGGWIKYEQFGRELKFDITKLKTDYGLVNKLYQKDSVLLINSMAGYSALNDMEKIAEMCKKNNVLLINDVSGSIGTREVKGDIILGSFGRWKPVNLESGGFIATDNKEYYEFFRENSEEVEIDYTILYSKLKNLDKRLRYFSGMNNKIKNDLRDFDIIHRDEKGINVIVKYEDDNSKIISYCKKNKYEYELCPREIRVLEKAVSIEVKRR